MEVFTLLSWITGLLYFAYIVVLLEECRQKFVWCNVNNRYILLCIWLVKYYWVLSHVCISYHPKIHGHLLVFYLRKLAVDRIIKCNVYIYITNCTISEVNILIFNLCLLHVSNPKVHFHKTVVYIVMVRYVLRISRLVGRRVCSIHTLLATRLVGLCRVGNRST